MASAVSWGDPMRRLAMHRRPLVLAALVLALFAAPACRGGRGKRKARKGPAVVVVDPAEQLAPVPEKEPNDERSAATLLAAGQVVQGALAGPTDVDWYRIELEAPAVVVRAGSGSGSAAPAETMQILSATVAGQRDLDVRLEAFDERGRFLVKVNNTGAGEGETLINLARGSGITYLRVTLAKAREKAKRASAKGSESKVEAAGETPSSSGSYRLSYRLRTPEPGEEREPNWKRTLANELVLGEEAVGYFGWHTDTDWYRVALGAAVGAADLLRVELDGVDGVWSSLSVYDARGRRIQTRRGRPGEQVVLSSLLRPVGDHFYVVARCGRTFNVESRYSLRVSAAPAVGSGEVEPNDTVVQASALTAEQTLSGLLPDAYDRDVFALKVDRPALLRVVLSPPLSLDPALAVLDAQGKVLVEIDEQGAGKPELLPGYYVRPPRVLLRVRARHPTAVDPVSTYRLQARLLPAAAFEREPNDAPTQATPWPAGVAELTGYLHPSKDVDYFRLARGGTFTLLPPEGVKAELALLAGERVLTSTATADPGGQLRVVGTAEGSLFIRVRTLGVGNGARSYRLRYEQGGSGAAPPSSTSGAGAKVAPIAPLPKPTP